MTDTSVASPASGLIRQLGSTLRRAWLGPLAPQSPQDDWALWAQACAGHGPSATALVQVLSPQALRLAVQLLRKAEDAQDAVQDAFLRLWNSQPQDTGNAKLATYFNTIVINRCKTQLLRSRELSTEQADLTDLADEQHLEDHATRAPQEAYSSQQLRYALASLPARQRMALALWAYADASVPDIARTLDLEVNATHQLLFRAKASLRTALQGAQP